MTVQLQITPGPVCDNCRSPLRSGEFGWCAVCSRDYEDLEPIADGIAAKLVKVVQEDAEMDLLLEDLGLGLFRNELVTSIVEPYQRRRVRWVRVGQGQGGRGCGKTVFLRCPGCVSYTVGRNTCRQSSCWDCGSAYGPWTMGEANRVTDRLKMWRELQEYPYGTRHVTISEPPEKAKGDWASGRYPEARTKARAVLRTMGSIAEVLIPHAFRKKCSICGSSFEFEGCPTRDCPGGAIEWVTSPHFHAFTYGRIDADKRPEGFVVKTIGERVNSLFEAVRYVLDHATRPAGSRIHLVTWGGALAYNKGGGLKHLYPALREKYDSDLPREPDRGRPCPTCGAMMEVLDPLFWEDYLWDDFGRADRPPPGGLDE